MSPSSVPTGTGRRPPGDDLPRMAEVALRLAGEACGQGCSIAGRAWRREAGRLLRGAMEAEPPAQIWLGMAGGYVDCLRELTAIMPAMAERAAMDWMQRPKVDLAPYLVDAGAGPEPEGERFEVEGKP